MPADPWKKIEALYHATLAQPPENRTAFLAQACPDEPQLRDKVQSLLDQKTDSSMEIMPRSEIKSLSAGTKLGNFEIVELLGRGGMGEVWRAHDARLKREVAIKVLPVDLARKPDRIARFEREARAASALNHPNIVAVYDIGHDHGTYWIASELVRGETLRSTIDRGPMLARKAIEVAAQVAAGLSAAHAAGLVHRDLKPANIMVTRDGCVKILDFGIAKQLRTSPDSTTADLTDEGLMMGTVGYMSPEQVRGKPADHRSDLFSVGVVLHEMLRGKRAFPGASSIEVLNAVLNEDPPELPASVPTALALIVRRCLEKEPDRRFQSAADLAFALQSSPPSFHPTRAAHRFKVMWAAAAAFVTSMAAALISLSGPLQPPRVTGTVQIVNDRRVSGAPMMTDGTRLYFNIAGGPRQVSVNGGESLPLALPDIAWLADISPDRTEFLINRFHDREGGLLRLELWVAPLLGGSLRRLGNLLVTTREEMLGSSRGPSTPWRQGDPEMHESTSAWSPDGRQLAYVRDDELHLARSDGTEVRKLATFAGHPFFVRWSPDGRTLRLSLSTARDSASSLWEVSTATGRVQPLLPGWDPSWYTCCGNWTPNGKYYVFQSRSSIWALREKVNFFQRAGAPVQLTTGPVAAYWPLPSLDSKRVFFEGHQPGSEFLGYAPQSGRITPEFPGVSGDGLEFSKDGKWVTYVSVPEASIFRSAADGSQRLQLTWTPLVAGMPHWSPNGTEIAFPAETPGKPMRIYVVPAEGGPVRQVTNGESGKEGDCDPSWSPEGRSIAFGSPWYRADARESIHVLNLETNRVSTLPGSEGMYSPRWSPSGRFIAGLSAGGWSPMLYDLKTQKVTQLSDRLSFYPNWSPDGAFLFFLADRCWWRVRMHDLKVERFLKLDGLLLHASEWFTVTPNNSLITAQDTGTDQIYALNLEAP